MAHPSADPMYYAAASHPGRGDSKPGSECASCAAETAHKHLPTTDPWQAANAASSDTDTHPDIHADIHADINADIHAAVYVPSR